VQIYDLSTLLLCTATAVGYTMVFVLLLDSEIGNGAVIPLLIFILTFTVTGILLFISLMSRILFPIEFIGSWFYSYYFIFVLSLPILGVLGFLSTMYLLDQYQQWFALKVDKGNTTVS